MALIDTVNPYSWITRLRNTLFDTGILQTMSADLPVVSVGNISVGGTGKTPLVRLITSTYRQAGFLPAVVSRGYKRSTSGVLIAGDGKNILATAVEAGDELILHAGDSIAIAAERRIEGCAVAAQLGANVVIVDDGFQHRQLRRELNIVILDNESIGGKVIPFGRLREPISSVKRANVVVLHENIAQNEIARIPLNVNSLALRCSFRIGRPVVVANHNDFTESSEIGSLTVFAVCGIAKPERFMVSLKSAGVSVQEKLLLPDHVHYTSLLIAHIIKKMKQKNIRLLMTTEKDAVKLQSFYHDFTSQRISVVVLPVRLEILEKQEEFTETLLRLAQQY